MRRNLNAPTHAHGRICHRGPVVNVPFSDAYLSAIDE